MTTKLTILTALIACVASAQPGPGGHSAGPGGPPQGSITGRVYDADLNVPVEYANVVLFRVRDSASVTGAVTREDGTYELTGLFPGPYYLDVSFIGYRTRRLDSIMLGPGARLDLGSTTIRQTAVEVPGTEVTAERPRLEFRIDKKIINVAQNPAVQSGTAVDALENAPGIKVDVENNVTLRGSGNFTVLIDGRPTLLGSSEALQQIPAGTIENIEIITNPSAKYDPEGVSGIVNVVLKKQKQRGVSGMVNVTAGLDDKYGGDVLVNLRRGGASAFIGANYNRMNFPGTRDVESWTRSDDTTRHIDSRGTGRFGFQFYGLRVGTDLQFGTADKLSIGGRWGGRDGGRSQSARYYHWSEPGNDTTAALDGISASGDNGSHLSATADYSHSFDRQGHDLAFRLDYGSHGGSHDDTTEERDTLTGATTYGRRTTDTGPRQQLGVRLEYALPLGDEDKFEAGYQGRLGRSREETGVFDYVSDSGYVARPEYGDTLTSRDDAHALYATWADHLSKLGYQLGLRGEYTGRSAAYETSSVGLSQYDLFPTVHLSCDLPASLQVMASYTRRIDRPRGWDLQPLERRMDRYNVRRGNPALKNEYIDALEAGFLVPFGGSRVSVDGYCRFTHNVIDHVSSLYPGEPGVMLRTVDNVGSDRSLGAELSADLVPFNWWNINLTGDVYDYRLDVAFADTAYSRTGFNWEAGVSTDFTFPTMTRIQLRADYESPSVEAQGTEGSFFSSSIAVRQAFLKRALVLTLQVRDLLSSGGHRMEMSGDDFYTKAEFTRKSPVVTLGLTWNFNNYRPDRRQRDSGDEIPETDEMDDFR